MLRGVSCLKYDIVPLTPAFIHYLVPKRPLAPPPPIPHPAKNPLRPSQTLVLQIVSFTNNKTNDTWKIPMAPEQLFFGRRDTTVGASFFEQKEWKIREQGRGVQNKRQFLASSGTHREGGRPE